MNRRSFLKLSGAAVATLATYGLLPKNPEPKKIDVILNGKIIDQIPMTDNIEHIELTFFGTGINTQVYQIDSLCLGIHHYSGPGPKKIA